MLIRFGCSNFKSIYSYQEIFFTASSLKDSQSDLISNSAIPDLILPSIAIYGANASGKTNLINGLRFFVQFIQNSHAVRNLKGIRRKAFKLNPEAKTQESQFDIDFIFENKHYHYGYKINDEAVTEEWLFSFNYDIRKSRTVLFHRKLDDEELFKFSKFLKGENKTIAKLTRINSLFLSAAAQNNHELFTGIHNYFRVNFLFRFEPELSNQFIARTLKEHGTITQVTNFLINSVDGIEAIELKEKNFDEAETMFIQRIADAFPDEIKKELEVVPKIDEMHLTHKSQNGELVPFELKEESQGTKALIGLLAPIFKVLDEGGVFVVDEIESSLHALLTLQVIKLFSRKKTNPKNAQLLFTTHETHLLCSNILRRDQIWFSEQNRDRATIISPLTDYKLRSTDNFHKGYLEGRFGAIPFLGNLQQLFQIEDIENG